MKCITEKSRPFSSHLVFMDGIFFFSMTNTHDAMVKKENLWYLCPRLICKAGIIWDTFRHSSPPPTYCQWVYQEYLSRIWRSICDLHWNHLLSNRKQLFEFLKTQLIETLMNIEWHAHHWSNKCNTYLK